MIKQFKFGKWRLAIWWHRYAVGFVFGHNLYAIAWGWNKHGGKWNYIGFRVANPPSGYTKGPDQ